mgnify:FL=1
MTISIYYYFKLVDNFNYKNILLFGFVAAIATSARIIGIFLPISYLILKLFEALDKKNNFKFWLKILIFLITYFVSLIILWPYLWSDPIVNFFKAFSIFSNYIIDISFLFNGDYVSSKDLPLTYIPLWILISTPVSTILFFLLGYLLCFRKAISGIFALEKGKDIWGNKNEEKDFFIFANFTLIVLYLIFSNTVLYNGWRQIYFLHFFIKYFAFFGIKYIFYYSNNLKKYFLILFFLIISSSLNCS